MALGCASEYNVTIHYRGGRQVFLNVERVESVVWSRERSKTSRAEVVIAASGVSQTCMGRLFLTYEWVHELSLYRNGVLFWQGPITEKVMTYSGDNPIRVTLTAYDVSKWLDVRRPRSNVKLTSDLSEIGRRVVAESMAEQDYDITDHVVTLPTGRTQTFTIPRLARSGLEVLGDVAALGMDWTALGRTLYMTGQATTDTLPIASLTSSDIVGEVDVITSGSDYAGRVWAAPQPQDNVWNHVEGVGGPSPYYGLVEHVVQTSYPWNVDENGVFQPVEDGLSQSETVEALRRAAQSRHTLMSRPPLVLRTGEGARLSASAPIEFEHLAPGVRIDLSVGFEQPQVVERPMRLVRVDGRWGPQGEEIGVALVQIGGPDEWET